MTYHQCEYESYILNEINIENYLKYKLNSKKENNTKKPVSEIKTNIFNSSIFVPREQETLFWCYYIILNGEANYEMLNVKNSLIAKQIKERSKK
jgi:hypothetical protein